MASPTPKRPRLPHRPQRLFPEQVILVDNIIDADGNLETIGDQTDGDGWGFELELTNGTFEDVPGSPGQLR